MRPQIYGSICAVLLLAGCQRNNAVADQQKATYVVTGDDHVTAATNSECKLFSVAEVSSYIGEPVGPPENAAMGSGCAWPAKDGDGEVVVAVIGAGDHEPPTGSDGYRKLASPGRDGYTVPQMGGWVAGAIIGDRAIRVTVMGQGVSEAAAAKLLADVSTRLH